MADVEQQVVLQASKSVHAEGSLDIMGHKRKLSSKLRSWSRTTPLITYQAHYTRFTHPALFVSVFSSPPSLSSPFIYLASYHCSHSVIHPLLFNHVYASPISPFATYCLWPAQHLRRIPHTESPPPWPSIYLSQTCLNGWLPPPHLSHSSHPFIHPQLSRLAHDIKPLTHIAVAWSLPVKVNVMWINQI